MDKILLNKCKHKLLEIREEIIILNNTFASINNQKSDHSGLKIRHQLNFFSIMKNKLLLIEIDIALHKIKNEEFGFCEHTGLKIRKAILLSKPWTRLSIESTEAI